MSDTVVPMPPRLPPSLNGPLKSAADLVGTEEHVAAVFIRDTGRVTVWVNEDVATPEHWAWLYRRIDEAIGTFRKMQAEQRPEIDPT